MQATIWFKENGDEYLGYFRARNLTSITFDPAKPNTIMLGYVLIDMDEPITSVAVDGHGNQPMDKPWTIVED